MIEKFKVSCDESVYEAWPDLVLTDGGKLICVFTECDHHIDRNNSRIAIVESTDRGRCWSKKRYLTEKTSAEDNFNCSRISKMPDGTLTVICDRVYGGEVKGRSELYVWHGDKEGIDFGEPTVLDFCGIVPDKVKVLKSGRVLISAHFKSNKTGKLEQYLWYSDDKGKSWSDRVTVAADPALNLCEVSLVETEDGALVAFLRENSRLGYDILKTISYNGGESFGEIYPTPMDCGHRPVAGYLLDGRVMVTYRFIPSGTQNLFAAFMPKEALLNPERNAYRVRIMPLDYDRNESPDIGYSGWVQFPDGEIYVVNYIKDDSDKAQIRGYSFYPSDVILPGTGSGLRVF